MYMGCIHTCVYIYMEVLYSSPISGDRTREIKVRDLVMDL